jgi:hypothetical protein
MCGVKPARRPELAAEVKYLTWTGDNLLRQVVYERLREDKPAAEVRREVPIGKPDGVVGHSIVTRDGGLCTKADSPRDPSAGRNGVVKFGPRRLGHFALDEFKRAAGPCDLHRPHLCHRRLHVVKLSSDAMMRGLVRLWVSQRPVEPTDQSRRSVPARFW